MGTGYYEIMVYSKGVDICLGEAHYYYNRQTDGLFCLYDEKVEGGTQTRYYLPDHWRERVKLFKDELLPIALARAKSNLAKLKSFDETDDMDFQDQVNK